MTISIFIEIHEIFSSSPASVWPVVEVTVEEHEGVAVVREKVSSFLSLPQPAPYPFLLLDSLGREIIHDSDWKHATNSKSKKIRLWAVLMPSELTETEILHLSIASQENIPKENKSRVLTMCCSALLFPRKAIFQPVHRFVDLDLSVCVSCARMLDPSLLSHETALSVPRQQLFCCQSTALIEMGFALPGMGVARAKDSAKVLSSRPNVDQDSPALLYLRRLFHREALSQQGSLLSGLLSPVPRETQERLSAFTRRARGAVETILRWEDKEQQRIAREQIDYGKILQYFEEEREKQVGLDDEDSDLENEAKEPKRNPVEIKTEEELLLIALMKWFKCDFFSWCTKPRCDPVNHTLTLPLSPSAANASQCEGSGSDMDSIGVSPPNDIEREIGQASRVEMYKCRRCQRVTRFARFNDAAFLCKHARRGRCGEFANAFGLICRSLGFDVSYVLDFTDHVWVEVFLSQNCEAFGGRSVHMDPCERALDSPLMYEKGWQKKLTHTLSVSRYAVQDAAPRYSRSLDDLLARRNPEILEEFLAQKVLQNLDSERERAFRQLLSQSTETKLERVFFDAKSFIAQLKKGSTGFADINDGDIPFDEMSRRKVLNKRELEGYLFLSRSISSKAEEHQGRQSGDLEWRLQRGEVGAANEEQQTMISCEGKNIATCAINPEDDNHVHEESLSAKKEKRLERDRQRVVRIVATLRESSKWATLFADLDGHIEGDTKERVFVPSILFSSCCDLQLGFDASSSPPSTFLNKRLFPSYTLSPGGLTARCVLGGRALPLCANAVTSILLTERGAVDWNCCAWNDFSLNALAQKSKTSRGLLLCYLHDSGKEAKTLPPSLSESFLEADQSFLTTTWEQQMLSQTRDAWLVAQLHSVAGEPSQPPSLGFLEISSGCKSLFVSSSFTLPSTQSSLKPLACCAITLRVSFSVANEFSSSSLAIASVQDHVIADASVQRIVPLPPTASISLSPSSLPSISVSRELSDAESFNLGLANAVLSSLNQYILDKSFIGVSVMKQQLIVYAAASKRDAGKALFLQPRSGARSFVRVTDSSILPTSSPTWELGHVRAYFHFGGGDHGDTLYFDSSDSLPNETELSSITLMGGEHLVNGVALSTTAKSVVKFSSSEGQSVSRIFPLKSSLGNGSTTISKIAVHAGALIDRLELHSSQGECFAVGGFGGERREFLVPPAFSLIGAFGGTGGHLHNFGLIFSVSSSTLISHSPVDATFDQLWSQAQSLGLQSAALINSTDLLSVERLSAEDPWRHNDLEGLIDRASALVKLSREHPDLTPSMKVALKSIVKYFSNIHKNPADENLQRINLTNNFFSSKILASLPPPSDSPEANILSLLTFGPAGFFVDLDNAQLASRFSRQVWKQGVLPSAQFQKSDSLQWISSYVHFLQLIESLM